MKWGDEHIGGPELGPVIFRYPEGHETLAQKYIYQGRWLLGSLKQQMQLGGLKFSQVDIKLPDGTKLHAQSNQWGLADIDEVWITPVVSSALVPDRCIGFIARVQSNEWDWTGLRYVGKGVTMRVKAPTDLDTWRKLRVDAGTTFPNTSAAYINAATDGNYFIYPDGYYFESDPSKDIFQTYSQQVLNSVTGNYVVMAPADMMQRPTPNVRLIGANYQKLDGKYWTYVNARNFGDTALISVSPGYDAAHDAIRATTTAFAVPGQASFHTAPFEYQNHLQELDWDWTSEIPKGDYEIEISNSTVGTTFDIDIVILGSQYPPFEATVSMIAHTEDGHSAWGKSKFIVHVGKTVTFDPNIDNPYVTVTPKT